MSAMGNPSHGTTSTGWIVAIVLTLAIVPILLVGDGATFRARLLVLVIIFACFAYALDIVFGQTDQLFLFLGALAGVGAYTMIGLTDMLGMNAWVILPVSALFAGLIGLLVSYVAARRRMTIIVIAILTLSLQLASQEVFESWLSLTGGSTGVIFNELQISILIPVFEAIFDARTGGRMSIYYLLLLVFCGIIVLYRYLMHSKYGLAFKAIRQDEIAAESIGISVIKYKVIAGFIAAFIIGFVGPFYAQIQGVVTPSMFTFIRVDVIVLIMLVLGGMRTLIGPILGAAIIIYLNEVIRFAEEWTTAIFGAMLIVLFLYFREGIVPKAGEMWYGYGGQEYLNHLRSRIQNR